MLVPGDKYNIIENYFEDCYPIYNEHNKLITTVGYSPAFGADNGRLVEVFHGSDGCVLEPVLKMVIEMARRMGYGVLGFENSKFSVTNDLRSPISSRTLDSFNIATQTAIEYKPIQKIIQKSLYNVAVRHSLGARVASDTNISSPIVAASSDEEILVQPYLMAAPGLVRAKSDSIKNDPTEQEWEYIAKKIKQKTRNIEGFDFTSQSNSIMFDIGLPLNWVRAFNDYIGFMNNIAYSLLPGDRKEVKKNAALYKSLEYTLSVPEKDIFKGNKKFIKFLSRALPQKNMNVIIGTDDESFNHLFSMALFFELKKLRPNRYNIFPIEGATHYMENKMDHLAVIMEKILFNASVKVSHRHK